MESSITIPIGWILGIIGTLGSVIAALAVTLWSTMKERLSIQDEIIKTMQSDIDRLSRGCGQKDCLWPNR